MYRARRVHPVSLSAIQQLARSHVPYPPTRSSLSTSALPGIAWLTFASKRTIFTNSPRGQTPRVAVTFSCLIAWTSHQLRKSDTSFLHWWVSTNTCWICRNFPRPHYLPKTVQYDFRTPCHRSSVRPNLKTRYLSLPPGISLAAFYKTACPSWIALGHLCAPIKLQRLRQAASIFSIYPLISEERDTHLQVDFIDPRSWAVLECFLYCPYFPLRAKHTIIRFRRSFSSLRISSGRELGNRKVMCVPLANPPQ